MERCNGEKIENCYNFGQINGLANIGGICGRQDAGKEMNNCYNLGKIERRIIECWRNNWIYVIK